MKFFSFLFAVFCASPTWAQPSPQPATSSTRSAVAVTPIASLQSPQARLLNPNTNKFPRGSQHDFSRLLDAPAGRHGFLQRKGAHFVWQRTQQRAKFWGINVANSSLQESDEDIARMVRSFAQAGFNLVRLHHFDERDGIIDLTRDDSRHFNQARLRKLDWWIYQCEINGLYVFLDLLDYRRFKEGDGVPNAELIGRAAKPYNVFNRRLIELQKEYARQLLRDHKNRYTKLSYADDAAIVMAQIYNESGLYIKRGLWRQMPPPYEDEFKNLWNNWLRNRYKTTEKLGEAWGMRSLEDRVLDLGESVEQGTVEVPAMGVLSQVAPANRRWADASRRADGGRFAHDVHVNYLREMKAYLRGIGFRVPVSVTGRFEDVAELKAIANQGDFVASNFYHDHPYWATGKTPWTPPSYFHNRDPLRDVSAKSFASSLSLGRAHNLPFVVREWNYCWPNNNRASGMIEAAAYASLHDMDALILFTYETVPTPRVHYFNVRSDPARWNLVGVASQVFLESLVAPSKNAVVVPYNEVDVFGDNEYSNSLYQLAWNTRIANDFYDETYISPRDATLVVPPGRSGIGIFGGATNAGATSVLWTNSLARDTFGRVVGAPQYLDEYALTTTRQSRAQFVYGDILFPQKTQTRDNVLAFSLPLLRAQNRETVGEDAANFVAQGFIDRAKKRLVFGELNDDERVLAAREALKIFNGATASFTRDLKVSLSDTDELRRDANIGRLQIRTPQFLALCGDLTKSNGLQVSGAQNGVVVALSLDGLPLKTSKKFLVKMVTNARNRDQKIGRDPRYLRSANGQWKVDFLGRGPVESGGSAGAQAGARNVVASVSAAPMRVRFGDRVLDVYGSGGAWEIVFDGAKTQFYSDDAAARFRVVR